MTAAIPVGGGDGRLPPGPRFEFHVSRACRERYRFHDHLYSTTGNVVFAGFSGARHMSERMNEARGAREDPARAVSAAQLNAMGLIDELMHLVTARYRAAVNPRLFADAAAHLAAAAGRAPLEGTLLAFTSSFPPLRVHRGEETPARWLAGREAGLPREAVSLEELLMLLLANENPAFAFAAELFDDAQLARTSAYAPLARELEAFLASQPGFGPGGERLLDILRAPMRAAPGSLAGQLAYIRARWGGLVGGELLDRVMRRLLLALDVIREETRGRGPADGGGGAVDTAAIAAAMRSGLGEGPEEERYSPDLDWMPRVVLLARNTLVWLAQLSRAHGRPVRRLDEVPDEELRTIAARGFTGLWLIGVWERSPASRAIKRRCGNADAESSAYSIFDYRVAAGLGGDEAFAALKARAWSHGIRMAVDMVPNHAGVWSRAVAERPDWFIQCDEPPFPAYRYDGPDLSDDPGLGVFIEDGYYDRRDAAVTFKRLDRRTGRARYVYHGNDGTHMPWNDTAQLDFALPEVREGVIRTILDVARRAPIIRFDAAMVLARRHFARLWYPPPGGGGDIPSRAERGMTKEEFDRAFPVEFWREVVDRAAAEAPETLLLAEAFWLMEGYFVRTLGMHRVYNSAFMHMLRREDNASYRAVLKNVLAFDPGILKRFVNFLSNPDEEPAAAQLGTGDKYFGACVVLATMPGLPLFGHGQVEGMREKYGMEYRTPRWDETPDAALVERHERLVFPLLRDRRLFAGVERFLLYDVVDAGGNVVEDVYAYSNAFEGDRALVVYHNRDGRAGGRIGLSVPFREPGAAEGSAPVRRTLAEGLALAPGGFWTFRDHVTGLAFIRDAGALADGGLDVDVGPYGCHVLRDFRRLPDDPDGALGRLAASLGGAGTRSIEAALREERLRPLLDRLAALFDGEIVRGLGEAQERRDEDHPVFARIEDLARVIGAEAAGRLRRAVPLGYFTGGTRALLARRLAPAGAEKDRLVLLWACIAARTLDAALGDDAGRELFWKRLGEILPARGAGPARERDLVLLARLAAEGPRPEPDGTLDGRALARLLGTDAARAHLRCNRHESTTWFNRERWMELLSTTFHRAAALDLPAGAAARGALARLQLQVARLAGLAERSGYDYDRLIALLTVT